MCRASVRYRSSKAVRGRVGVLGDMLGDFLGPDKGIKVPATKTEEAGWIQHADYPDLVAGTFSFL